MAATARTHITSWDNTLLGANLTENFQYAALALHAARKAAGYIVLASSDGVTADLTDRVSVIADVVSALASNPHTWIVYQCPAAMGDVQICVDCVDTTATPEYHHTYGVPSSGYTLTGLSVNTKPVATGGITHEWSRSAIDLIPTSIPSTPMSYHSLITSDGELLFGVSVDGSGVMGAATWAPILVGGDALPSDPYPYAFYSDMNATGALRNTAIGNSSYWRAHHTSNTDISTVDLLNAADFMTTWTGGISSASGAIPICPLDWVTNSASQGRYLGRSQDYRGCPELAPFAAVEDGDTDTYRRTVVDGLWLMVEASSLPLVL